MHPLFHAFFPSAAQTASLSVLPLFPRRSTSRPPSDIPPAPRLSPHPIPASLTPFSASPARTSVAPHVEFFHTSVERFHPAPRTSISAPF